MSETVTLWRLNVAGIWECDELSPYDAIIELCQNNAGYLRARIEWGATNARLWDMGGMITHYVPNWPQN